jgi:hypothetical protein
MYHSRCLKFQWCAVAFALALFLGSLTSEAQTVPNFVPFPSESWHSYQLQYKNAARDPGWSNLAGPIGGNDTLQTITDSASSSNRFYRIQAR